MDLIFDIVIVFSDWFAKFFRRFTRFSQYIESAQTIATPEAKELLLAEIQNSVKPEKISKVANWLVFTPTDDRKKTQVVGVNAQGRYVCEFWLQENAPEEFAPKVGVFKMENDAQRS